MNIVRFLFLPLVLLTHQNVLGAMPAPIKVQPEKRRVHEKEEKELLEEINRLQRIEAQKLWDDEKWDLFLSAVPVGPDKHKFQTACSLGISFFTFVRLATLAMQLEVGQSLNKKDKEWHDEGMGVLRPRVQAEICKIQKYDGKKKWDNQLWRQTIISAPSQAERAKCEHAQALGMTHDTYARLSDIRIRLKTPQAFDTCVSSQENAWYRDQLNKWIPRVLESLKKPL